MGADIEWLFENPGNVGIMRIGLEYEKFGDPYEASSILIRLPDGGVRSIGLTSTSIKTIISNRKVVRKMLLDGKFEYFTFERRLKDGSFKVIRFNK